MHIYSVQKQNDIMLALFYSDTKMEAITQCVLMIVFLNIHNYRTSAVYPFYNPYPDSPYGFRGNPIYHNNLFSNENAVSSKQVSKPQTEPPTQPQIQQQTNLLPKQVIKVNVLDLFPGFVALKERVDSSEDKSRRMKTTMEQMETKIEQTETKWNQMQETKTQIETKTGQIETKMRQMDNKQRLMETKLNQIDAKVNPPCKLSNYHKY